MARRKPKPESLRDKLLRLLRHADLSSVRNLAIWLRAQLLKSGLQEEWEALRNRYVSGDPVQDVRGPAVQDYFIVLIEQHRFLAEDCNRMRRRLSEEFYEKNEGTGYLSVDYITAKGEQERTKVWVEINKRRVEFLQRKRLERLARQAEAHQQSLERQRNRSPRKTLPCNWGAPMPIFSERDPVGYCQATGQYRRKILDFLKQAGAKPVSAIGKSGRGRPHHIYGVKTNLLVLDRWLGRWLPSAPNSVADAIIDTLMWQFSQEVAAATRRKILKILYHQWQSVRPKLTDPALIKEAQALEDHQVFTDDALWLQLRATAWHARLRSEKGSDPNSAGSKAPA
jgi:hypothetical protein